MYEKWISVKDRLPGPDNDVLLYFGYNQENTMVVGGKYGGDEEGWYTVVDGECFTDCDTQPLYWMLLPEPPKEG